MIIFLIFNKTFSKIVLLTYALKSHTNRTQRMKKKKKKKIVKLGRGIQKIENKQIYRGSFVKKAKFMYLNAHIPTALSPSLSTYQIWALSLPKSQSRGLSLFALPSLRNHQPTLLHSPNLRLFFSAFRPFSSCHRLFIHRPRSLSTFSPLSLLFGFSLLFFDLRN